MSPVQRFWRETVELLDVMWPRGNQWERALVGKKCQLYNNKDCFYSEPTSQMWFSVGPCCCCFIVDICYKLKCFCYICFCSTETSCLFPVRGHIHDGRKPTKISAIEFCDDSLQSSFEKLMKIKIDTYSNKGIVQITKPWIKTKSPCSFQPTWHLSLVPFKRCVTQGLEIQG